MIDSVVTWNVGPGRRFRDLLLSLHQLIEADDDVVALFEMTPRNTHLLRAAMRPRWRVLRPKVGHHNSSRRADVVLLIRRRVPMPEIAVLSHRTPWIGPKEGLPHRGRAFVQATWGESRILFVHRTPGGPKGGVNERTAGQNLESWEADKRLIERANAWPGPFSVVGDQNATADELRPEYEAMGLIVYATVSKVDHAASRDFPRFRGHRLGKFGSDHPAVRWRLS